MGEVSLFMVEAKELLKFDELERSEGGAAKINQLVIKGVVG